MTPPGFDPDAIATGSVIGLNVDNASPPTAAYVSEDDYLYVGYSTSLGSGTLNVSARILMPNGSVIPNRWPIQMVPSRAVQTVRISLPEGFLLSCSILLGTAAVPRSTYATLAISRPLVGAAVSGSLLVQGYADTNVPLSWPGGLLSSNLDVSGCIQSVVVTVPAAGADWTQTVPANARWRISSVIGTLTPSAVVANRGPRLLVTDGTNTVVGLSTASFITAGTPQSCIWADSIALVDFLFDQGPLVRNMLLPAGWVIKSSTLNLQAGDQWSAIYLVIEEWLVP